MYLLDELIVEYQKEVDFYFYLYLNEEDTEKKKELLGLFGEASSELIYYQNEKKRIKNKLISA